MSESIVQPFLQRGYDFSNTENYLSAIEEFSQVIDNHHSTIEELGLAYLHRAYSFGKLERTLECLSDYDHVVVMQGIPDYIVSNALIKRSMRRISMGERESAFADFDRVLSFVNTWAEDKGEALLRRGLIFLERKEYIKSRDDLSAVLDLNDISIELMISALNNLAYINTTSGMHEEAIGNYSRIIELKGASRDSIVAATFARGKSHIDFREFLDAEIDFDVVINSQAASPSQKYCALLNRAFISRVGNSKKSAVMDCMRAARISKLPLRLRLVAYAQCLLHAFFPQRFFPKFSQRSPG